MSDIFISYASEDRTIAKILARELERQNWSVWWDREFLPGGQFSQIIEKEIIDEIIFKAETLRNVFCLS